MSDNLNERARDEEGYRAVRRGGADWPPRLEWLVEWANGEHGAVHIGTAIAGVVDHVQRLEKRVAALEGGRGGCDLGRHDWRVVSSGPEGYTWRCERCGVEDLMPEPPPGDHVAVVMHVVRADGLERWLPSCSCGWDYQYEAERYVAIKATTEHLAEAARGGAKVALSMAEATGSDE